MRFKFVVVIALATAWSSLANGETVRAPKKSGVTFTEIGRFDLERLRKIVTADLETFLAGSPYPTSAIIGKLKDAPKYPVTLYKVHYRTSVPELRQSAIASGLLAVPDTPDRTLPTISYQHGTVFERTSVPSSPENSYETLVMLAVFASQGYVLVAADYVGLGDSTLPNSYAIRGATIQACADLITAAQKIQKSLGRTSSGLFLHGWSQGGYNTLLLLKHLEMSGTKVIAASTAAAPTDVRLWVNRLVNNRQPRDAPWLVAAGSNLLLATDRYEMPGLAKYAIRPEYQNLAKQFYEFKIDFSHFFASTPHTLKDFLQPEFAASGQFGSTQFWQSLDRKENYRWAHSTPLRNYFGEVDEAVPPDIAILPATVSKIFGTDTEAISAGPQADHRATFLYSLTDIPNWHRTFLKR